MRLGLQFSAMSRRILKGIASSPDAGDVTDAHSMPELAYALFYPTSCRSSWMVVDKDTHTVVVSGCVPAISGSSSTVLPGSDTHC